MLASKENIYSFKIVLKPSGEAQGRGSLVGCHLWGCTESDTTEVTQQQRQQQRNRLCNNGQNTMDKKNRVSQVLY